MKKKDFLYSQGMNGENFERLFLQEAIRRGEEKYGNARAYGIAMWPHRESRVAGQTMYNLRNVTKTGKPQSIKLHEAVRMVELLECGSFASFCFEISEKLRISEEPISIPAKKEAPSKEEKRGV